MLSIRLSRKGKKKYPIYRIIVTEKQRDPWGKYLEILGHYNPHNKEIKIDAERIQYWINNGAQPTETVHNLLVDQKVITKDKVKASKSKPGKKRQAELAAQKAQAAAAAEASQTKDTPQPDTNTVVTEADTPTANQPTTEIEPEKSDVAEKQ